METKNIQISDYNYELPDARIAKFPMAERDHSKLLIYDKGSVGEDMFYNLPQHLPAHALMVFNNTKVIQARLHFRKDTGALIEVFLLEPAQPADYEQMFQTRSRCSWLCLVGNQKKWKEGALVRQLSVNGQTVTLRATRRGEHGTSQWIDFEWDGHASFAEIIDVAGELPIPPYLNRETQESDLTTYQTVYSKIKGSVAAPTAGLHFTERVLAAIDAQGIEREELTLHVGAGTFRPVKSATIGDHPMHTEYIAVRRHTIERILAHQCQVIAVGTTSVRTLESLYYMGLKVLANPDLTEDALHVSQWEPYDQPTALSRQWHFRLCSTGCRATSSRCFIPPRRSSSHQVTTIISSRCSSPISISRSPHSCCWSVPLSRAIGAASTTTPSLTTSVS